MRLRAVSDMTSPYLVSRRTHVPNDSLRTPRNSRLDRRDDRSGRQNRRARTETLNGVSIGRMFCLNHNNYQGSPLSGLG